MRPFRQSTVRFSLEGLGLCIKVLSSLAPLSFCLIWSIFRYCRFGSPTQYEVYINSSIKRDYVPSKNVQAIFILLYSLLSKQFLVLLKYKLLSIS